MKSPLSGEHGVRGVQTRSARIQSGDFVSALHVIQETTLNAQVPDNKLIVGHTVFSYGRRFDALQGV